MPSNFLQSNTAHFQHQQKTGPPSASHSHQSFRPDPICVLKIELEGESVEEIRVYEGDIPSEIVERFGDQFNLTDKAKG